MNQDAKKKLTLTVATVQTLEAKAAPSYEYTSGLRSHALLANGDPRGCPTGQIAAVAYY